MAGSERLGVRKWTVYTEPPSHNPLDLPLFCQELPTGPYLPSDMQLSIERLGTDSSFDLRFLDVSV